MSHIDEKSVLELNKVELTTEVSHKRNEGKLLNIFKEEERYIEDDEQHCDDVFEEDQRKEIEFMEFLLEGPDYENEIAGIDRRVSQVEVETKICTSLQTYVMFSNIHRSVDKYDAAVRNPLYELLLESKAKVQRQQINIAEGNVYGGIQDVSCGQK